MGYKYIPATNKSIEYGFVYDYNIDGHYNPHTDIWFEIANMDELGLSEDELSKICKEQVASTGYSIHELLLIEKAFEESAPAENIICFDGYLGLMSVIDTLMQVHEATTEEATQAKELFVKINC